MLSETVPSTCERVGTKNTGDNQSSTDAQNTSRNLELNEKLLYDSARWLQQTDRGLRASLRHEACQAFTLPAIAETRRLC